MAQRIRRHLSFANVTSLMALVFAMGGTGYALTLPRNSVGAKQLRANAVTSAEVKNRSLRASDFGRGQLPSGTPGELGPTGPPGPQGETGSPGVGGVVGPVTVWRLDFSIQDGEATGVNAKCPPGTTAIGGGSSLDVPDRNDIVLTASRPWRTVGDPPAIGETFNGWRTVYNNPRGGVTGGTGGFAYAVCAEL